MSHASSRNLPQGRLVHAVDGGTRIALDNEVVPFVTEKDESTFTLTEEAIKIGDLKFEWQADDSTMRSCMSSWATGYTRTRRSPI